MSVLLYFRRPRAGHFNVNPLVCSGSWRESATVVACRLSVSLGPCPSWQSKMGNTRMSGVRDAQRYFDAGVLSLGIPIDELETDRDVQYAALAFRHATEC